MSATPIHHRTWSWYALAYVLTLVLLNLPSALLWLAPEWQLAPHEYDWFLGQAWATTWLGEAAFTTGRWFHSLLFLVAGGLFARLVWPWFQGKENPSTAVVGWTIAGASVVSLTGLPWVSPDVFYYLGKGWLAVNYGADPYSVQIAQIPGFLKDPLFAQINPVFQEGNLNYGPLFQPLAQGVVWLANGSPGGSLLLFKILMLMAWLRTSWTAARLATATGQSPTQARLVFFAVAANPIALFALVTCAHNDALIALAMALALLFALRNQLVLAAVVLGLGFSIKYLPLLLFPVLLLALLAHRPQASFPQQLKLLFTFSFAFLVTVALCHLPSAASWENFGKLLGSEVQLYRNNSHFLLSAISVEWHQFWHLQWMTFLRLLFVLVAAGLFVRWWRKQVQMAPAVETPLQHASLLLVLYLLLASIAIHEWYLCWFLPIAFALSHPAVWRSLLVLSAGFPALVIWSLDAPNLINVGVNLLVYVFCLGLAYWTARSFLLAKPSPSRLP